MSDYPEVTIEGTLRMDRSVKQVTGATVTVENAQGVVIDERRVSTNSQFHFDGLREGTYIVTAVADGYEPFQQTVELTQTESQAFVNITLKPAGSSTSPTGNLPSRTDTLAPGKARKEWEKAHFDEHADRLRRIWE